MVLVDVEIKRLCKDGMIHPFNTNNLNPSSLDICVGTTAYWENESGFDNYSEFYKHTEQKPYGMLPDGVLQVCTGEFLNLPQNVSAIATLKTSMMRRGLSMETIYLDAGFNGRLTLCLKNNSQESLINIHPGMRIASIAFLTHNVCENSHRELINIDR